MIDLKMVINNLPIAVLAVDSDRRVVFANREAEMVAGLNESDMRQRRGGDILGCVHAGDSPDGRGFGTACQFCDIKKAINRSFQKGANIQPFESNLTLSKVGRREFRVSVTYIGKNYLLQGERGEPLAILTIEDITDFRYTERLGAAMVTIGAVCHEMNQPLMACMGHLELMRIDHPDLDRLQLVLEQLSRLAELSRRLQSIRNYATRPHDSTGSKILDVPKMASHAAA